MKNLPVIATMSFLGLIGVNKLSPGFFTKDAIINLFWLAALLYLLIWYFLFYRKSAYFLIKHNISMLHRQVNYSEWAIRVLMTKIANLRQKLLEVRVISDEIINTAEEHISIWEDQIEIYKKLIEICEKKISSLNQNRNELDLLNYMIRQLKREPKSEEKVKKLESLVSGIDEKVNSKVKIEIEFLTRKLKLDTRKENIIHLKERVGNLERRVG